MNEEVNTSEESLTGERDVSSSGGQETDANVKDAVAQATDQKTLKDVLGEQLGKSFKTDEAALKAVKDTFNYVGEYGQIKPLVEKAGGVQELIKQMEELKQPEKTEQASPVVDPEKFVSREEYDAEKFYGQNPQYNNPEVKAILGTKPTEALQNEAVKSAVDKIVSYAEVEKSKSVLETNPRLGQAKDKIGQSRDAIKQLRQAQAQGDTVGAEQAYNQARDSAISAVLETLDIE